MRIFLSYGHDHNQELVLLIKRRLEEAGHDTWIDQEGIKFGEDWRRRITDGIRDSDLVLAFLSRHSTRHPGVCLSELAIALNIDPPKPIAPILVEDERQVAPPVAISRFQWLDMSEWREYREERREIGFETWFRAVTDVLLSTLQHRDLGQFAGEIEALSHTYRPLHFESRIARLIENFSGREWVFAAIDEWLRSDFANRVFLITGLAGTGKSAIAARLSYSGDAHVVGVHFCEFDSTESRSARRAIESLAFQLATRLPDYRRLLLEAIGGETHEESSRDLFSRVLAEPLQHIINPGERLILVIDALDEAGDGDTPSNEFVDLVARGFQLLPSWLSVVVTSRPEPRITRKLSAVTTLTLDPERFESRVDLNTYVTSRLEVLGYPDATETATEIERKSEGNILYARMALDGVARGEFAADRPGDLPDGLSGMYLGFFERQLPDMESFKSRQRPLLELVVAAHEPLPETMAKRCLGWDEYEWDEGIEPLGSLFPNQRGIVAPFHQSVVEWIGDPGRAGQYHVSRDRGRQRLGAVLLEEYRTPATLDRALVQAWAPRYFDTTEAWGDWVFLSATGRMYMSLPEQELSWTNERTLAWDLGWLCWERALELRIAERAPGLNPDLRRLVASRSEDDVRSNYRDVSDTEGFLRLRISLFDEVTVPDHRQIRFDWARLASLLVELGRPSEARTAAHRAQQICWNWNVDGDDVDRGMANLLDKLPPE